ncbi:MAG TPA: hypothetical protein VFF76_02610 [Holophagaceae bacterium]|jgi:hypothetical protein|nr:hypothetical protein [Holophagaceae bacterium]
MDRFLIAPTFLRLIREGRFFRPVFAWILRIQAALAALGAVLLSIELWKQAPGLSTGAIFGLLILQLSLVVAAYFVCHLSLLRASDLLAMGPAEAGALAVARLLMKLSGEIYAGVLTPLSLGSALLIWTSAGQAGDALRNLFGGVLPAAAGDPFQAGLTLLATGLAMAAAGLLGAYALSAFVGLFVSIEQNTRKA